MDTYTKIKNLIQSSSLTSEEADKLLSILKNITTENQQILIDLLTENIDWARLLHKNYQDKVKAFSSGDKNALKEILTKEAKL